MQVPTCDYSVHVVFNPDCFDLLRLGPPYYRWYVLFNGLNIFLTHYFIIIVVREHKRTHMMLSTFTWALIIKNFLSTVAVCFPEASLVDSTSCSLNETSHSICYYYSSMLYGMTSHDSEFLSVPSHSSVPACYL